MSYFGHMWGWDGGAWEILMWAGMIAFWVAVILALVLLLKSITQRPSTGTPGDSALDILERRYARGEISREEYERTRDDLRGRRAA